MIAGDHLMSTGVNTMQTMLMSLTRMFSACEGSLSIKPIAEHVAIYNRLLPAYAALEYSITRT